MIRPRQPAKTNNLVAHRKILRETPWLVFKIHHERLRAGTRGKFSLD